MERLDLLEELLKEKRRSTMAHIQYISTAREYAPGKELFMREVHFLSSVNSEIGSTGSEIAEKLEVTLGAISQLATRLEKKGLIIRSKSASDKRQTLFTLTEKGREIQSKHIEYDKKCFNEINNSFKDFDNDKLNMIIEYEKLFRDILRRNGEK